MLLEEILQYDQDLVSKRAPTDSSHFYYSYLLAATTHISTIYIYFSKIPAVSLYLCCFLTTGTYQYYISIYVEWVQVLHLSFNKGKYSVLHFDTFKISVQNYNIEHCKNNFYFEICRLYHILLFKISVNVWLAGMVISHVQFSVKLDNS